MYYLTSRTQVKEELVRRRKQRNLIRSILDRHIESTFGIADYSQFIRLQIAASIRGTPPLIDEERSYGVLARQVPGTCAEDIACYLLSRNLGLVPSVLAFTRDSFNSNSNDKLYRVKVPFISWSKKSRLVVHNQSVVTDRIGSYSELDMVRMDRLQTDAATLVDYHRAMQHSVFASFPEPYIWADISPVYGEILARVKQAGKQPPFVWRSNGSHKDARCETYTEDEARTLVVRPSSKWYYHLYLSMFLDGTFVLLETYDNETGGVPEARKLFETEMRAIQKATGFMPLVIKTSPLRPDMLFVNQHLIDTKSGDDEKLSQLRYWSEDTSAMTRWFADQVIQCGRTS